MLFRFVIFIFLFRKKGKREQVDENDFRAVMVIFFSKVSLQKYLITAIATHLDNGMWNTPYNWKSYGRASYMDDIDDIGLHRCRACSKTFDSLLYASLGLKQA